MLGELDALVAHGAENTPPRAQTFTEEYFEVRNSRRKICEKDTASSRSISFKNGI